MYQTLAHSTLTHCKSVSPLIQRPSPSLTRILQRTLFSRAWPQPKRAHDAIVSVIAQWHSELVSLREAATRRALEEMRSEGDCASASREPTQGPQGPIHDNARFI